VTKSNNNNPGLSSVQLPLAIQPKVAKEALQW